MLRERLHVGCFAKQMGEMYEKYIAKTEPSFQMDGRDGREGNLRAKLWSPTTSVHMDPATLHVACLRPHGMGSRFG
jgi:hypothetical protein